MTRQPISRIKLAQVETSHFSQEPAQRIQAFGDWGRDKGAEIAREIISHAGDTPKNIEEWEAYKAGVAQGMQSAADQIAHDQWMSQKGM